MATSSLTLKQRSSQQLKEFLVIALYLWMVFGLLVMYKSVILAEYHIDFMYHGFAIINALALAKVMLVAKDLHLDERFNEAPLIYPALLKSALFTVVLVCFKILEVIVVGLYRGQSFDQSSEELGGGTWKGILSAYPFRGVRRTAKSSRQGEIGTDPFPPTPVGKLANYRTRQRRHLCVRPKESK